MHSVDSSPLVGLDVLLKLALVMVRELVALLHAILGAPLFEQMASPPLAALLPAMEATAFQVGEMRDLGDLPLDDPREPVGLAGWDLRRSGVRPRRLSSRPLPVPFPLGNFL